VSATPSRTPSTTPSPSPQDPATANLFFGYSGGTFSISLSSAIYTESTTVSLSGASITGYTDSGCTSVNGADSNTSSMVINAGGTSANSSGNGFFTDPYYQFDNSVYVNSTFLSHNSTIVIGNTTVTIKLPQGCNAA
jgi:hypothetical protein